MPDISKDIGRKVTVLLNNGHIITGKVDGVKKDFLIIAGAELIIGKYTFSISSFNVLFEIISSISVGSIK